MRSPLGVDGAAAAPLGPEVLGFAELPPRLTSTCLRPLADGSGRSGQLSGRNGLSLQSGRTPWSQLHLCWPAFGVQKQRALLQENQEQRPHSPRSW